MTTCRFCGEEMKPQAEVKYCAGCREERRALAKEHFDNDGKVTVVRGKYVTRVPRELVQGDDVLFEEWLERLLKETRKTTKWLDAQVQVNKEQTS
jgi:hypothetical protein